jgi:hypothetical protein
VEHRTHGYPEHGCHADSADHLGTVDRVGIGEHFIVQVQEVDGKRRYVGRGHPVAA